MKTESKHLETLAVHAGQTPDPTTGAVSVSYDTLPTGSTEGADYVRTTGTLVVPCDWATKATATLLACTESKKAASPSSTPPKT